MEDMYESVETQEVADPVEEYESEESQEVAEPETPIDDSEEVVEEHGHEKNDVDSAFAEMRRQNKELEKQNAQMMRALQRYFSGDDATELSIQANAYAEDRDPEDVRAEYERDTEFEEMKAKYEELQEQMLNSQVEQAMSESLREVQTIDPNVTSLDQLGDEFLHYIGAGLSTKEAYYASMMYKQKEEVQPPSPIGKLSDNKLNRDYYTSEELDNLTEEELDANWDKVMKSMGMLNKRSR